MIYDCILFRKAGAQFYVSKVANFCEGKLLLECCPWKAPVGVEFNLQWILEVYGFFHMLIHLLLLFLFFLSFQGVEAN